jgi:hypothetical protein
LCQFNFRMLTGGERYKENVEKERRTGRFSVQLSDNLFLHV